jgi:3-hydroxyisobutyrate dehydrogenase/2-hydroxy-3-oxopropionate reductase
MKVGFIGLGNMGLPMCKRLLAAGLDVQVFDINLQSMQAAIAHGAAAADSADQCALEAEVLLTSLPRPEHVETVMVKNGTLMALKSGSIWVDLTTNRKELVIELAQKAPSGVAVLDSPVTGAVDGARNGKLTLFVGGDKATFEHVSPLLSHLGKSIYCGSLGSGNVVKLVTNQLWFIAAAAIGEGFATGISNGVELGTLWGAIKDSVGDSFVVRHDAPSIFAGHYDPSFSLELCLKDLGLINELNQQVHADLPMTNAAISAFTVARQRYGPHAAELHVAKRIEDDANISMRLDGNWTPPWEA